MTRPGRHTQTDGAAGEHEAAQDGQGEPDRDPEPGSSRHQGPGTGTDRDTGEGEGAGEPDGQDGPGAQCPGQPHEHRIGAAGGDGAGDPRR